MSTQDSQYVGTKDEKKIVHELLIFRPGKGAQGILLIIRQGNKFSMRQKNLKTIQKTIYNNIAKFISHSKKGYSVSEYAIRFIGMYSVSFLDNVLLYKLMPKVIFRVCESIFTPFSSKAKGLYPERGEKSFIGKGEERGWSKKEFGVISILYLVSVLA